VQNYVVNYQDDDAWKRGFLSEKRNLRNCPKDYSDFRRVIKNIQEVHEKFQKIFNERVGDFPLKCRPISDMEKITYFVDELLIEICINLNSGAIAPSGDLGRRNKFEQRKFNLSGTALAPSNVVTTMMNLSDIIAEQLKLKGSMQ